jgi:hypothetical protein
MKRPALFAAAYLALSIYDASAQSNPGLVSGQVPTAQQWNSYFSGKVDYLQVAPNAFLAGPSTGLANNYPGYRAITTADLPPIPNGSLQNAFMNFGPQQLFLGGTAGVRGTGALIQLSTGPTTNGHCAVFDASGNLTDFGSACGVSPGAVTTTGSPAASNLVAFSGSTTITNGNLSGDVVTSGSLVATVAKVNGVAYGPAPSNNTVPVVTGSGVVSYETVPNAALANSSVTFGGQNLALGASATVQGNGGKIQLSTGSVTSGHVAAFDGNGNTVDSTILQSNLALTNVSNSFTGNNTFAGMASADSSSSCNVTLDATKSVWQISAASGNCTVAVPFGVNFPSQNWGIWRADLPSDGNTVTITMASGDQICQPIVGCTSSAQLISQYDFVTLHNIGGTTKWVIE